MLTYIKQNVHIFGQKQRLTNIALAIVGLKILNSTFVIQLGNCFPNAFGIGLAFIM
jgi:hypothetical protein